MSIDQRIVKATEQLETDVGLTHEIVTGDENTVVEVSPGNLVRSPKKMIEDAYNEAGEELEGRFGSLEEAIDVAITQAKHSERQAGLSEQSRKASDASAERATGSAKEAAGSANEARASEQASNGSALQAASSEAAAKQSEASASVSAGAAGDSEAGAERHRQAAASSAQSAAGHQDGAETAQQASEASRAMSEKWAEQDYDTPVTGERYSSLHWAEVARRLAGSLTNGMYFAGHWNPDDGLPSAPTEGKVPWYRVINGQDGEGEQLIWDPIAQEWFLVGSGTTSWGDIIDRPPVFPPSPHNHSISSVTDLRNQLDGKEPLLAIDRKRKITISEEEPSGGSDGDIWFVVEKDKSVVNVTVDFGSPSKYGYEENLYGDISDHDIEGLTITRLYTVASSTALYVNESTGFSEVEITRLDTGLTIRSTGKGSTVIFNFTSLRFFDYYDKDKVIPVRVVFYKMVWGEHGNQG